MYHTRAFSFGYCPSGHAHHEQPAWSPRPSLCMSICRWGTNSTRTGSYHEGLYALGKGVATLRFSFERKFEQEAIQHEVSVGLVSAMGTFRMLDVAKVPGGVGFVDDLRSGGRHFDRCRDGFSQTGVRAAQLNCRRNGGRAVMHWSPSSGPSASLALRKRRVQLTQWQADVGSTLLALCCVRGSSAPGAVASEMSTTVAGGAGESRVEERTSTANAVPDTPLVAQSKLLRKLSDANLCIRQLRRELQARDETIADFKAQIVALELELKALARISLEVATAGALPGTRKINGRYLQSHLAFRLEEIHNGLLSQIREVEVVRDIELVWMGMAESVQVMGSFDGWTDGVEMSPLVTGAYTRFLGTLKLPRGRYEIKFLVDGEWQLSPELLVVGEGLACNNLLVVE